VRCARALQIIREDGLVEQAARVGAYFRAGLEKVRDDFDGITNVRGRGLFLAFDVADGKARDDLRQRCWNAGLASLSCGPRSIRFRPSLIFTEADVDRALAILRQVLAA